MIFRRGYAAVDEELRVVDGLYNESGRFTDISTRLISSAGKNLTLFGEASSSVTVIRFALTTIDGLLSLFRAAPGIGKIIQKLLDPVVTVVRQAIPPFQRVLGRLSRTASLLNATVIPVARDVVRVNLLPLVQTVQPYLDALLIKLAALERQQALIEAVLPRSVLQMLTRRVEELEGLTRRSRNALRDLKATNDLLEDRRAFLDRVYGMLSVKKVVLDTVRSYLDEIASAINAVLGAVGNFIPDVVKNFITALLDYVDTAIDWVLEQLRAVLAWLGIDISGPLAWVTRTRDKLARELADLLSMLRELENFVAPLEELLAYLQGRVMARIDEATRTLRDMEARSRELLALLNGLGAWKEILERELPGWIRWLRARLKRIDADGPAGAAAIRRELERITGSLWRLAAIPPQDFMLLGDWSRLAEATRVLLSNKAVLNDARRRREAVREIEAGRRRLEAAWTRRYGKAAARLPEDYFEMIRVEGPAPREALVALPAAPRVPKRVRYLGEADALLKLVPRRRAAGRRRAARSPSQRRLEAKLKALIE